MQLLADDWAAGRDEPDSMAVMTATGVAGALAELGDEAGAVAIERTYGVRRAATPQPEP